MIVAPAALKNAMAKAMSSMNDLSVKTPNVEGHRAPVCIVCNCLCDTSTLCWVDRKILSEKRMYLRGPEDTPASVRDFYTYTGNGNDSFMDVLLLSPHASSKIITRDDDDLRARRNCFSCCRLCLDHLSKAW